LTVDRRSALKAGMAAFTLAASGAPLEVEARGSVPIIDSHIHLFDPNRPQGTPAVIPGSSTAQTGSFPAPYRQWAEPLGVVGAVHIEASNWVEDNLWALETARANEFMLGVVGNINPEKPDFDELLERFHRDPLFRGIRYGNIWGYDLAKGSTDTAVIARLRRLAESDLAMDTATPDIALLNGVIRLSDAIPTLRIVIDHLPGYDPEDASEASFEELLRELSVRTSIYVKLSQIIHSRRGAVSTRLSDHREALDRIVTAFGEERILFGSDYPTSDMVTTPQQVFRIAREYLASRSRAFQEKVFFRNALQVYRLQPRSDAQRKLLAGSSEAGQPARRS
jgi:L-fuconolactonase